MPYNSDYNLNDGDLVKIIRPDGSIIFIKIKNVTHTDGYTDTLNLVIENYHNSTFALNWNNCYSFGNGVESNRIRDAFNAQFVQPGVIVSTIFEDYKEEHLKNSLIYSGLYNSISNTNNLNQFVQAEKITKNLNPVYGSIQKLHTRDTDLIALCEDKIIKILANKDAVFNADGNPQLVANQNVLGQAIPFVGEYGISRNPESFASEAYRAYFTDKARGAVMRLSKDGLTPISDHGMRSWFKDNLKLGKVVLGSFDDKKDEYNLTIKGDEISTTISFKENVKGWVSFKSFVPEHAISCNNGYFTFNNAKLWLHHQKDKYDVISDSIIPVDRNTFYGHTLVPSSVTVVLNQSPGVIKSFYTLNYEGSQSAVTLMENYTVYHPGTLNISSVEPNNSYYNLTEKDGWSIDPILGGYIKTDQERGSIIEFIEKEGKWFNYIKGITPVNNQYGMVDNDSFDNADNCFQGLGLLSSDPTQSGYGGCMDPNAFNYDSNAAWDDGSCSNIVNGCTDSNADNYDPLANVNDGSCIIGGCTDPLALNYNVDATYDDGGCIAATHGCTDPTAFNYNPQANTDNGSCIAIVYGCTDDYTVDGCGTGTIGACNYNASANTDDGSCTYVIYGCTDIAACNFDSNANTDDGTCLLCGDSDADNYDGASCNDTGACTWCTPIGATGQWDTLPQNLPTQASPNEIELEWDEATQTILTNDFDNPENSYQVATILSYDIKVHDVSASTTTTITGIGTGQLGSGTVNSGGTLTYMVTGLTQGTQYKFQVIPVCANSNASAVATKPITTSWTHQESTSVPLPQFGCTDPAACNYDASANTDDGTCYYAACGDPLYLEYDPSANCYDNVLCQTLIVNGCTDATAFNFDPAANIDDGSCVPVIEGCLDATPNFAGGSGGFAALNYNANANTIIPCIYSAPSINQPTLNTSLNNETISIHLNMGSMPNNTEEAVLHGVWIGVDGVTPSEVIYVHEPEVNDILNPGYNNWGPTNSGWNVNTSNVNNNNVINISESSPHGATLRNALIASGGSSLPQGYVKAYIDPTSNVDPSATGTTAGVKGVTLYSSVNPAVNNMNIDDMVLNDPPIWIKYGCADSTALNYDSTANVNWDADCVPVGSTLGCNDPYGLNYNATDTNNLDCKYLNQFDGSTVNNTQNAYTYHSSNPPISHWTIGFGAPNIKTGINLINGTNYALATGSNKDKYVVWARWTDETGQVFASPGNTTSDGWMRITRFGYPSWTSPNEYNVRVVNTGNWTGAAGSPSWDDISFKSPGPLHAPLNSFSGSAANGITSVEIAVFPIIDKTLLPTTHPDYDNSSTANDQGSRLTVPSGADLPGFTSATGPYLSKPPNFPTNTYTLYIT